MQRGACLDSATDAPSSSPRVAPATWLVVVAQSRWISENTLRLRLGGWESGVGDRLLFPVARSLLPVPCFAAASVHLSAGKVRIPDVADHRRTSPPEPQRANSGLVLSGPA